MKAVRHRHYCGFETRSDNSSCLEVEKVKKQEQICIVCENIILIWYYSYRLCLLYVVFVFFMLSLFAFCCLFLHCVIFVCFMLWLFCVKCNTLLIHKSVLSVTVSSYPLCSNVFVAHGTCRCGTRTLLHKAIMLKS